MKKTFLVFMAVMFVSSAALAQEKLTAIDILLEPDAAMVTQAKADNALLRQNYPQGFALDRTHNPHISMLQCFVKETDLGKIAEAVKEINGRHPAEGLALKTKDYFIWTPEEETSLIMVEVQRTPGIAAFQKEIIEMLRPFIVKDGTGAAFVPNQDGSSINPESVEDVEKYLERNAGEKYRPHVTLGLGRTDFLKTMAAAPYQPFDFHARCISIFHLGNFGTARARLWSSGTAPAPQDEVLIMQDKPAAGDLPANFRTPDMVRNALLESKSTVSREGLENLRASGSAEPWETAFPALKKQLGENVALVDLRQEPHGFLNGAPIYWYLPPGDWINLGKTREEVLQEEQARIAALAKENLVTVHEDSWAPGPAVPPGKDEKVSSVTSEEKLAALNGIRYFRFPVPDHMRPSDEDVDRFIHLVRGLDKKDWLHFHCHAGMGRTTLFLVMQDMLMNAGRVSLEDIVARQAAAGAHYNLFRDESGAPWGNLFRERAVFVRQFYEYAKAFCAGSPLSWTEWLKNGNDLKVSPGIKGNTKHL